MKIKSIISLFVAAVCIVSCGEKQETDAGQNNVVIPELPTDPQPDNTSFSHRVLLIQHTGTDCPNCPKLMSSMKELAEDENYVSKYHHVASHSYPSADDKAHSAAADELKRFVSDNTYPKLTFNLTEKNTGKSVVASRIKDVLDDHYKEAADAGIAASVQLTGDQLGINVQIKAAKSNEYRILAWLLEDNIYSEQHNATEDWMHTHSNVVRAMAGDRVNLRIFGDKVGALNQGETGEKALTIKVEEGWNVANCKVLVGVSALGADGVYDLVNCALCPIGGNVVYQYNQ